MKTSVTTLVVAALLGFAFFRGLEWLDDIGSRHEAALQADFDAARAGWVAWHRQRERVIAAHRAAKVERQRLVVEQARRMAQADQARRAADSLRIVLAGSLSMSDSLVIALRLVDSLDFENFQLRHVIGIASRDLIALAADRDRWKDLALAAAPAGDSVATTAVALTESLKCYLVNAGPIKIGCPSRTVVVITTAVTTLVVSELLRKEKAQGFSVQPREAFQFDRVDPTFPALGF